MEKITAPFNPDQVKALNAYQDEHRGHPFTCKNDGDEAHIKHEFEKRHPDLKYERDYENYITEQKKIPNVNFPEMRFTETNLVATENGWVCPVCDYKQNWAHAPMADPEFDPLKEFRRRAES